MLYERIDDTEDLINIELDHRSEHHSTSSISPIIQHDAIQQGHAVTLTL